MSATKLYLRIRRLRLGRFWDRDFSILSLFLLGVIVLGPVLEAIESEVLDAVWSVALVVGFIWFLCWRCKRDLQAQSRRVKIPGRDHVCELAQGSIFCAICGKPTE